MSLERGPAQWWHLLGSSGAACSDMAPQRDERWSAGWMDPPRASGRKGIPLCLTCRRSRRKQNRTSLTWLKPFDFGAATIRPPPSRSRPISSFFASKSSFFGLSRIGPGQLRQSRQPVMLMGQADLLVTRQTALSIVSKKKQPVKDSGIHSLSESHVLAFILNLF